jgi:hypothetical protein
MNLLIRLATFARSRRAKQQGFVDHVPEIDCRSDCHPQMSNGFHSGTNAVALSWLDQAGCEQGVNDAVIVAERWGNLEIDNGRVNQSFNGKEGWAGGRFGRLAYDGSYNFYEWDRTKGCMVPFRLSNPIVSESSGI